MANEFFTILTEAGRAKLANATATGAPLTLTHMAVGDGQAGAYYSPTEAQAALKNEVWRGAINHLAVDASNPNWIVAELVIPDDVGGFYVREVGLFDSAGAMIAVGKFPESYKPTLAAGSNKQLYVRMILEVANTAAVTLLVDPSVVLATRKYADDKIADELNKRDGKQSVRAATTAAIALAGLQAIDGVALAAGDRVLVKDQVAGEQNGIYVAAAGNWTRAVDADSGTKLNAGALVPVETGAVNADTIWMLKTDGAIIIGVTAMAFQWAGGLNIPASATAQTQPQFNASTKLATTDFVQRALGSFSGISSIAIANAELTTADCGKLIAVSVASTVTLPLAGDVAAGACIYLSATGVGDVVMKRAGADTIVRNDGVNVASLTIKAGTSVQLRKGLANSAWIVVAGDAMLPYSSLFGASLSGIGFQKLPSGLILQWGEMSTGSTTTGTVTFPVSFPTKCLSVHAEDYGTAVSDLNIARIAPPTTTGFTWFAQAFSGSTAGIGTWVWMAIGH